MTANIWAPGCNQDASSISYTAPYANAVARTQASKDADIVNIDDFSGANDTAKFQNAVNSGASRITYTRNLIFTGAVTIARGNLNIVGDGVSTITWDSSSFTAFLATAQSKITFDKVFGVSVLDSTAFPFVVVTACLDVTFKNGGAVNGQLFYALSSAATYALTNAGNSCARIVATGNKVTRTSPVGQGAGAVTYQYVNGGLVEGNFFVNVDGGVQLWGGDAAPAVNGALANQRKCTNITVANNDVNGGVAGCWGSMMQNCVFEGNTVLNMTDTGIDLEGSFSCTVTGNTVTDAVNGCLTTFSYCRDSVFSGNTCRVTHATYPLFRVYNASQDTNNKSVLVVGNTFIGDGVISSVDNAFGPVETLDFRDNILKNCIIAFAFNNSRYVIVEGNQLLFDMANGAAFNAITVLGLINGGLGIVRDNRIRSQVTQPAGTYAIYVDGTDFNTSPVNEIDDNYMVGFPNDLHIKWEGANAGIIMYTRVRRNTFDTGNYLREEAGGAISVVYFEDNRLATGVPYPTGVPATQYWNVGNEVKTWPPVAGGFARSICTTAGTPGTWKTAAAITP